MPSGAAFERSRQLVEDFKELVRPLYTDGFSVKRNADPSVVMNRLLGDNFQSVGSLDTKGKDELIGQIQFFWRLVPDLKWEVQDMRQDGNMVIVRSIASGSPKGEFMGMTLDGSKSFKIMTIDIHSIENGKITQVYHLEDWATAIQQLKG